MKIFDQIRTTKFYVISIDLSDPEVYLTSGIVFGKVGERIDVVGKIGLQALDEALSETPANSNVIALFTGDQVLTRVAQEEQSTFFEEIDEEDFYIQKTSSKCGWMIHTACRRSIIDPIAIKLTSQKLFLLDISFGPAVIPVLEEHIENDTITIAHHRFEFKENELINIEEVFSTADERENSNETIVAGMLFSPEELSQLAAALHFFKEGPAQLDTLPENNMQSKFFSLFRRASVLALSGLFVVLLTNFLLFDKVQKNLIQLNTSGKNLTEKINEIERLQAQISEFRELVTYNTSSPENTYTFYLDEIARTRPSGIWFNNLEVHPMNQKQELNKPMEMDHSLISISGEAKDPVSLNRLINSLEEMSWIRDIELRNYESSPGQNNAGFAIAIKKEE